jgi:hypothetical protein
MVLRYLLALAIVAVQLAACSGNGRNTPAVDEIEHRHEQELIRMGGGGGSM